MNLSAGVVGQYAAAATTTVMSHLTPTPSVHTSNSSGGSGNQYTGIKGGKYISISEDVEIIPVRNFVFIFQMYSTLFHSNEMPSLNYMTL